MASFGWMLYSWGPLPFEVYPLNVHEVQQVTATDWARKEIAGAAIYREWVGENDEEVHLRGRVYPHFFVSHTRERARMFEGDKAATSILSGTLGSVTVEDNPTTSGGLGHLDVMDNMRLLGQAHILMRGDGWKLGWFVIEKLTRGHTFLDPRGIGRQIEFEVTFQRVPTPLDPSGYFPDVWGQLSP